MFADTAAGAQKSKNVGEADVSGNCNRGNSTEEQARKRVGEADASGRPKAVPSTFAVHTERKNEYIPS